MPVAETDRLILREATDDDFDDLLTLFNDDDVMRFYRSKRDEAKTRQWIESSRRNYERYGHSKWIVEARAPREFLGYCGLLVYPIEGIDEIELGYMFKRGAWGLGYATEAARVCLAVARDRFGYRRVVSIIDAENVRARRVAERLGMSNEREVLDAGVRRVLYATSLSAESRR